MTENFPIYADRNIGNMDVQTAYLVQALLGKGPLTKGCGQDALWGARIMAINILSNHAAFDDEATVNPSDAFKAARLVGGLLDNADSPENDERFVEAAERAYDLCRQMARTILSFHSAQ